MGSRADRLEREASDEEADTRAREQPRTAYVRDAFGLGDHPGEDAGHSGNSENDRP